MFFIAFLTKEIKSDDKKQFIYTLKILIGATKLIIY